MSGTFSPVQIRSAPLRRLLLALGLAAAASAGLAAEASSPPADPVKAGRELDRPAAAIPFGRRLAAPLTSEPTALPPRGTVPAAFGVADTGDGRLARWRPYRRACNFTTGC